MRWPIMFHLNTFCIAQVFFQGTFLAGVELNAGMYHGLVSCAHYFRRGLWFAVAVGDLKTAVDL